MNKDLLKFRKQIDNIDDDLLEILKKRFDVVQEISEIKRKSGLHIEDSVRQTEIIDRLHSKSNDKILYRHLEKIYSSIFDSAKEKQLLLSSREYKKENSVYNIGGKIVGERPVLIAGPCSLDDGEMGFLDCELCCWNIELLSGLGDGYCDDMGGCWFEGPQYDCPELGYDCGDCNDEWDGSNAAGLCDQLDPPCAPLYDTNGDGIVDILDLILVVNFILGTGGLECNIDYDDDGMVNVLDLVIMINIILDLD